MKVYGKLCIINKLASCPRNYKCRKTVCCQRHRFHSCRLGNRHIRVLRDIFHYDPAFSVLILFQMLYRYFCIFRHAFRNDSLVEFERYLYFAFRLYLCFLPVLIFNQKTDIIRQEAFQCLSNCFICFCIFCCYCIDNICWFSCFIRNSLCFRLYILFQLLFRLFVLSVDFFNLIPVFLAHIVGDLFFYDRSHRQFCILRKHTSIRRYTDCHIIHLLLSFIRLFFLRKFFFRSLFFLCCFCRICRFFLNGRFLFICPCTLSRSHIIGRLGTI